MELAKIENETYLQQVGVIVEQKNWTSLNTAKVIAQFRDQYLLREKENEFRGQVLGTLLFESESSGDLPVVGDWVVYQPFDDQAIIHGVLPRKNSISREKGKQEIQVIAANVDIGLIVMGADRDYNLNRVERYQSLCYANSLKPILVVSKIETLDTDSRRMVEEQLIERFDEEDCFLIDSLTGKGLESLREVIKKNETCVLLGSSGAGKSTLINALLGHEKMKTGTISEHVNKGKHTTTHRELVVLQNGAFVIDNPGIRSVGVGAAGEGVEHTFAIIEELAKECRFANCAHVDEPGCQVLEALQNGEILEKTYENFQKMVRETSHYESTEHERRKKQKSISKLVKNMKKTKRRNT